MKTKTILAALAVAVLSLTLAACKGASNSELKQISQQRAGDYVITLLSDSGQLKQGKNKYVMEFRKAADNQLVDVGEVKLNSLMPMPGMPNMVGGASATKTTTPGRYEMDGEFEMRGKWNFSATFGNGQRVMFPLNVQ